MFKYSQVAVLDFFDYRYKDKSEIIIDNSFFVQYNEHVFYIRDVIIRMICCDLQPLISLF